MSEECIAIEWEDVFKFLILAAPEFHCGDYKIQIDERFVEQEIDRIYMAVNLEQLQNEIYRPQLGIRDAIAAEVRRRADNIFETVTSREYFKYKFFKYWDETGFKKSIRKLKSSAEQGGQEE